MGAYSVQDMIVLCLALASVFVNCDEPETKVYGGIFSVPIPEGTELLEFTHDSMSRAIVAWNPTDPKGGRGSVNRNYWEITGITQQDSGFYKFWGKDNNLLASKRLKVKEDERHHVTSEGKDIYIRYPDWSAKWTIIFMRGQNRYPLIQDGYFETSGPFGSRIEFLENAITIDPLQYEDSGTFEFRDANGNLARRVELEVETSFPPALYYVIIAGGIFLALAICCCVKKCCCKKSSSKRNNPAPRSEGVSLVYYHPSTDDPATYNQVNVSVNPPHPEVVSPGGQGATPLLSKTSDFTSSDSDPQFHMKGISSASPLNSDSTICDVYTSNKLNFL